MSKLFVDEIVHQSSQGSGTITIGASGETINVVGTLQNNGSAVGGVNTPAFMAYASSDQTINNGVYTKVQINTELYDTDNAFDNTTNYRFTPQTAGKYYFFVSARFASADDFDACVLAIYKNGSAYYDMTYRNEYFNVASLYGIADMNGSSDYIEFFVEQGSGLSRTLSGSNATRHLTKFGAFKIIE